MAQDPHIKRIIFTWDFFKNDKPTNSKYDALTFIYLTDRFNGVGISGEKVKFTFDITVNLDTTKSYFGFEGKYREFQTLKHEQGHADLAVLYARQLLMALQKNTYPKRDYSSKIHMIYKNYSHLLESAQIKYDDETAHGMNRQKQDHASVKAIIS